MLLLLSGLSFGQPSLRRQLHSWTGSAIGGKRVSWVYFTRPFATLMAAAPFVYGNKESQLAAASIAANELVVRGHCHPQPPSPHGSDALVEVRQAHSPC